MISSRKYKSDFKILRYEDFFNFDFVFKNLTEVALTIEKGAIHRFVALSMEEYDSFESNAGQETYYIGVISGCHYLMMSAFLVVLNYLI